jgi:hypothetical protein
MNPTDTLVAALGPWLSAAALQLDQERLEALRACLQSDDADVRIVIRLKEGAIVLDATNNGQRLELYREDVAQLRLSDAFRHQEALKWILKGPTRPKPLAG